MHSAPRCPICHKTAKLPEPGTPSPFPFCSERCRQIDLLRWSKGEYAIVEPVRPEHLIDPGEGDDV